MILKECSVIQGAIEVITGLHIGDCKDAIEIGGMDSPVVKNLYTGEPYIPGSSLKGKLRCLLEWATGRIEQNGETWEGGGETDPAKLSGDPVLRIFGTTNKNWKSGPTRLVVRDSFLNKTWRDSIIEKGLPFTEEKFENNIDRIQGKAGKGIRRIERVPTGAIFDFQMVYRIFDMGDKGATDEANLTTLLMAMRLLEADALGGSGSRGYGHIEFKNLKHNNNDHQAKFKHLDPTSLILSARAA